MRAWIGLCLIALAVGGGFALAEEADDDGASAWEDSIDSLFGGEEEAEDEANRLFEEFDVETSLEDKLTIGGLLQLRLDTFLYEETPPGESPLTSQNLLDLYFDVRPNDRVRGFVNLRYRYDPTVNADGNLTATELQTSAIGVGSTPEREELLLDQMWIKFDIARRAYVTVGKQQVKYGSARFFNPTDFVNNVRRDPLAVFDVRTGVHLARFHFPVESLGWNFYAIANWDGADTLEEMGATFRWEAVFGATEISLMGQVRKEEPIRYGADLSTGLGPIDVYVEAATQYDRRAPFYRGELDLASLQFPEAFSRRDEWLTQVTTGFEYSFKYNDEDSIFLGAEYMHNELGYDDGELLPFLVTTGLLTDQPLYEPLFFGKHYLAAFVLAAAPGSWNNTTILASAIGNLSDESWIVRADYSLSTLTYLTFNVYAQVHIGKRESELRSGYDFSLPTIPPIALALPANEANFGIRLAVNL